ncbi:unnamed protein product, partial [Mesorhabditis belari]|uniref:PUM-HD domain-containing protein n=1 Tax=Mesorhabditis belari TaxID=2138241 RepID=A0AAF3FCA1_9BILA
MVAAKKKGQPSQQERRKVVKQQHKQQLMTVLKSKVKDELEKLSTLDKPVQSPTNSESSFGSAPLRKAFPKRGDLINTSTSEASPGRSILTPKRGAKLSLPKKELVVEKHVEETVKVVEKKPELVEEKPSKLAGKSQPTTFGNRVVKKKEAVKVTKKVKEQLLLMPRKERKAFLVELRKKQKPNFTLAAECKTLWEQARMGKTPQAKKDELIKDLVGKVKGHAKELIYAHDMSRVFQFLLKLEREGITSMLFDELNAEIIRMSKSMYARHFVRRMLKYGTKLQKQIIIEAFKGHAVSMLANIYSADILESVYNEYADAQQRFNIITEFYGQEFVVFRIDTIKTLDEILADEPGKRQMIMKHLEEILLEKCTNKVTLRHSLVHKLLFDLLEHGDKEQKSNLLDSIKDKIPEIVHTPYGARVAMRCVWLADAKDRKLIVKNFKDLSEKAAMEKNGQRVLWAIFDQVDDTVLINKFITSEIANNVGKLLEDRWGCLCLEYMVHPRDGRSMDYNVIKELELGDKNTVSKKDKKDRYSEIFLHLIEPLLTYFAANMRSALMGDMSALTSHVLHKALELQIGRDFFERKVDSQLRINCYEAIADVAAVDFIPMDPNGYHLIESRAGGWVTGQLLRQDSKLPEEERLAVQIVKRVPEEFLANWVGCNKGCFALLRMWENGGVAVQTHIKKIVDVDRLDKYSMVGARLLKEAVTGIKSAPRPKASDADNAELSGSETESAGENELRDEDDQSEEEMDFDE